MIKMINYLNLKETTPKQALNVSNQVIKGQEISKVKYPTWPANDNKVTNLFGVEYRVRLALWVSPCGLVTYASVISESTLFVATNHVQTKNS